MFEDRSKKSGYDFKKLDQNARTQTLVEKENSAKNMTEAQKRLFTIEKKPSQKPTLYENKNTEPEKGLVLENTSKVDINSLPSSKYISSFDSNLTVGEAEDLTEKEINSQVESQNQEKEVDISNILEEVNSTKINNDLINKELRNAIPAPKKNYSFRIKLIAGVYCILVALFGGWVIGNAINISKTNTNIYNSLTQTEEINADIDRIILKIKNFDNAASDPDDESLLVEMITESITVTPEEVVEPNDYTIESNWFDAFCNWF